MQKKRTLKSLQKQKEEEKKEENTAEMEKSSK